MQNITKTSINPVAAWLLTCCFFVLIMVAIGGLTRLTESGLSITEWKPVSGIVPPFSENSWQDEFSKYQQSPEYLKKNLGLSLEEFKGIFWLEFIHRLIGRLAGIIFFIPMVYFIIKQRISKAYGAKLACIFAIGGAQGVIGWYMVKSGLKDAPHVSHYWLAFHLCTAVLVYGLLLWAALCQGKEVRGNGKAYNTPLPSPFSLIPYLLLGLIFLQIMLGAFVAGMHAGLIYNTFPDMDGKYIPDGLLVMSPWYMNFLDNATTIQFTHRIVAYIIAILIFIFWLISYKFSLTKQTRCAIALLPVVVIIQIILGVATLIHQVPLALASLHQVFALVVFTVMVVVVYRLKESGGYSATK